MTIDHDDGVLIRSEGCWIEFLGLVVVSGADGLGFRHTTFSEDFRGPHVQHNAALVDQALRFGSSYRLGAFDCRWRLTRLGGGNHGPGEQQCGPDRRTLER